MTASSSTGEPMIHVGHHQAEPLTSSPRNSVVPNFIAQTGDPSGTGKGGECIYDEGEPETRERSAGGGEREHLS